MTTAIQTIRLPITTTGTAGSATGSATTETLIGFLLDIYLDFHASTPATTDTTIGYAGRGGSIMVLSNSATDGLFSPRAVIHDPAAAAITGGYDYYALNDAITISLAGSDARADAVVAYIRVMRP